MDILVLLGCLFALFALSVPIAYSLGLAAIAGALWIGVPLEAVMSPPSISQQSVFAHRPFALFWASRVLSTTAFQMQSVAVGWLVYELTGSALDLGLVGLAQFVPMLALALVTGHVADNFDRRRILVACQTVKLLTATALGLGSLYGGMRLPVSAGCGPTRSRRFGCGESANGARIVK